MPTIDPRTGQPLPDVAAGVPGVPIQLPEQVIHTGWHSGTTVAGPQTTETVARPEELQALEDQRSAQEAQLAAADERNAAEQRVANIEALSAQDLELVASMAADKRRLAQIEHEKRVAPLIQQQHQRRQEMESAAKGSTRGYWEDQSIPKRVLAAFLTGLGHYASAMGGGPNGAAEVYRQAEEDDRQRKIQRYMNSKEFVQLADTDVDAAHKALAEKLADINNEEIVQGKLIDRRLASLTKRIGTSQAQAKYNEWRGEHEALGNEKLAKEYEHLGKKVEGERTTTTKGNEGGVTENRNKDTGGPKNNDTTVYGEGGKPVAHTATPKQADESNKAIASFRELDGLLGQLQTSYTEHGKGINPLGQLKQDQNAIKGQVKIAYKNAADLGALSGPDVGLIDDAINGGYTGDQATKVLQRARDLLKNRLASTLDARGIPGGVVSGEVSTKPAPTTPAPKREAPKPAPEVKNKATSRADVAGAMLWLKKNPNDPRAAAIRAKVNAALEAK